MDAPAETTVPGTESAQAWFPRSVLAGYGVLLGAAGGSAGYQTQLAAPARAMGVSALVLGGGCLVLAARRRGRPAAPVIDDAAEPESAAAEPEVADEAEAQAAELETAEPQSVAEEGESRTAIPAQPAREEADAVAPAEVPPDSLRLERLEAELADERARVDRVTAELAALRQVVVEQRSATKS
ncbi:MAG TPA: hypothetical protein VHU88_12560 [Sporichthyaceae bacterium]|nr:hypothetical protein [Sporichthyaceae bacterium]